MISVNIKPIDPTAPGSWRELTRAHRILRSNDLDAIEALVREIIAQHSDAQDVDAVIGQMAVNDLRAVVEARYSAAQADPLPQTSETSSS